MQAQPLFRSLLVSVQKLTDMRIETGIKVNVSHVDPDLAITHLPIIGCWPTSQSIGQLADRSRRPTFTTHS